MKPRTRLLIIDDDQNIASSIKRNLELNHAFDVSVAASGKEGLALARNRQPEVILLDVMMPGMAGGEVAEALREHGRTKSIPIVYLTGLLSKAEAKARSQASAEADDPTGGATGGPRYLAKPASIEEIVAALRGALAETKAGGGAV